MTHTIIILGYVASDTHGVFKQTINEQTCRTSHRSTRRDIRMTVPKNQDMLSQPLINKF